MRGRVPRPPEGCSSARAPDPDFVPFPFRMSLRAREDFFPRAIWVGSLLASDLEIERPVREGIVRHRSKLRFTATRPSMDTPPPVALILGYMQLDTCS